ncbi:3'(2'),5'-bisphosphate nucleotidase [Candidatus Pantoea edessiphila]|uniref:3'(2'),5'-bisphosphate nucleotidase CysQ n=1 Tax=Candidatus Pantoea edessiphila TaxID=2044610 RepID=A0A2P5SY08_9GAMM|nr:3'(2'),5'-bisphosphate nucleotidase CysQ [Candidatus Pantoea edessiphila]MBK4775736.1 3'(2'),5'-bisphosphate nucleotidase CysQ [Pantoea sp. Edef]PPI87205.1 3'(2'),5'-bisphosphate nucleotidase [Candidatus Pantoea edessiphila]
MIKNICVLARLAGDAIMSIYNNNINCKINKKNDKSPVTNADIKSNDIIIRGLSSLTPSIPILSEENLIPWEVRKNWQVYWLIDPLDGTKEFIKHNGEFTINIALIEQGIPKLGVVYAPALNAMYYAIQGKAWKMLDGKPIKQIHSCYIYPPSVAVSRSHNCMNEMNEFLLGLNNYNIIKIGSSLKFCLIAEGKIQFYPRFSFTNIWDTGAGHAIALAAGAHIHDWNGKTLNYIPRQSLLNPKFLVSVNSCYL